jgi:hypothetical protein
MLTDNPSIFCEFCDVQLIKKMDDIHIFGKEANGATRFVSPSCGRVYDPTNLEDKINSLKHGEKGQTIRSGSDSSNTSGEGVPFAEVFSTTTTAETDKKDSSLSGTQLNRSLQSINDPEPNEEANLRSQNMRMLKTTTEYPESSRKVVTTYD